MPSSGMQSKLKIISDTEECPELKSGLILSKSFELDPSQPSPTPEAKACFIIDDYITCNEEQSITSNEVIINGSKKMDTICPGNGHQKPCQLHAIYQFYKGNKYEAEMIFNSGCTGFNGKSSAGCINLAFIYSIQGKQHLASRYMMKACDMSAPLGCYTLGQYYKTFDDPARASYFFNKTCELLTGKNTCQEEVATFAIKNKYKGKIL